MVRLHRAGGHQDGAVLPQGVGHQELQLARFVAAERQAGQVIALDQDARTAALAPERRAQPLCLLQGRRQRRELKPRL